MNEIEICIADKKYSESLYACLRNNYNHLGKLLSFVVDSNSMVEQFEKNINSMKNDGKIISVDENTKNLSNTEKNIIKVKLIGNWCTPKQLRELWNKMSQGNYTWNNIKLVLEDDADYFVVINCPPSGIIVNPSKTIVFRMEPHMGTRYKEKWGEWSNPDPNNFFRVCYHHDDYNNLEWHLSKTYNELKDMRIKKDEKLDNIVSTVLSEKYFDPGHIKRIDFVKFLETKGFPVHVFGNNKWNYKYYKGPLPPHKKDKGMFPYKYVFNCENNNIKNYYTEKLIDGILAECLVFYSGCHNVKDYIDERAFVYLELSDLNQIIKK